MHSLFNRQSSMVIKTDEEIEKMRKSCELVSRVHELIAQNLKVGISGLALDKMAEEFIRDNNALPSFKGYHGFPSTLCISPNYTVVHGFPKDLKTLIETDIVSVDCGVNFGGFHGDCAYTYTFSQVDEKTKHLLRVTKESLYHAINYVKAGIRTGDLGFEIQHYCEKNGYSVVRELCGHGVGRNLHEEPDVPNYGKKGKGVILKKNVVIAIEPMINLGKKEVVTESDNWTVNTKDRQMSAHFEHTVRIGLDKSEHLTTHHYAEEAIKLNKDLILV
jgi:methionyl aminopeptidase